MSALMAGKFSTDMFLGVLPAILPVVREQFGLSLSAAVTLVCCIQLSANLVQVLIGHLRPYKRMPLILFFSLALVSTMCLTNLLPRSSRSLPALLLLVAVSGCGDGIYNPEALRAVHRLRHIQPAMGSSLYMASAFAGYAGGGWLAAALVSRFSLAGLYFLPLLPAGALVLIALLRVRLFIEKRAGTANAPAAKPSQISFRAIMMMGILAAVSTNIFSWLLPTRLVELGFELTFGGLSIMIFCLGAAVGSFFWAFLAHKKGELFCLVLSLLPGALLMAIYLCHTAAKNAVWLLFAIGFCCLAGYPLMITMARHAAGPNLGRRMALIIGGVWGIASVVVMLLGPVADRFGVGAVLRFAPIGYVLAGIFGLALLYRARRLGNTQRRERNANQQKKLF